MNCNSMESLIALYVEGDLPLSDRRRVETHLQSCTACNALAEDLRESQSMFKVLRAATVSPSELAGVRERVRNEVGDLEPAPGWVVTMHRVFFAGLRRRNAIAGVLLAALVTGSVWYSQSSVIREVKNVAPIKVASLDAPAVAVSPDPGPPQPETHRPLKPTVMQDTPLESLPEIPASPSVLKPFPPQIQISQVLPMKFLTDDPDIIIYWLPTDKGD